jgi:hypothetical protein
MPKDANIWIFLTFFISSNPRYSIESPLYKPNFIQISTGSASINWSGNATGYVTSETKYTGSKRKIRLQVPLTHDLVCIMKYNVRVIFFFNKNGASRFWFSKSGYLFEKRSYNTSLSKGITHCFNHVRREFPTHHKVLVSKLFYMILLLHFLKPLMKH